jgi:hypothetical protein
MVAEEADIGDKIYLLNTPQLPTYANEILALHIFHHLPIS